MNDDEIGSNLLATENSNTVPAGNFRDWLADIRASLRGENGANVPCGDCVGCCVSSYYIPLRPRDEKIIAKVSVDLLTKASGDEGHYMMGYRADGSCPMLKERKCSVYHERPQTCRDYDCRIFAAAGIVAGGDEKAMINRRVGAWRFSYACEADERAHRAVQAAASFIQSKGARFPGGRAPTAPTGIAVLAIKAYAVFLDVSTRAQSDDEIAAAIVRASGDFDAADASDST